MPTYRTPGVYLDEGEPSSRPIAGAGTAVAAFVGIAASGPFGTTPTEAFFVKCDRGNNPPEAVAAGKVVVDIGVAPMKPAEFVDFRLSQQRAEPAAQ